MHRPHEQVDCEALAVPPPPFMLSVVVAFVLFAAGLVGAVVESGLFFRTEIFLFFIFHEGRPKGVGGRIG